MDLLGNKWQMTYKDTLSTLNYKFKHRNQEKKRSFFVNSEKGSLHDLFQIISFQFKDQLASSHEKLKQKRA